MDITKSYLIEAPLDEVWQALVDPEVIETWSGSAAQMNAAPGSAFSLWEGDIFGTVVSAEPPTNLVEEWYGGDWAKPSIAAFSLTAERGGTRLTLTHSGVPEDEVADFDAGWDDYYLGPLKELLES
jgi:activator of HSP90 ATPase